MVQNLYKLGLKNVSIPEEAKCFNTPHLYTTNPDFYHSSIKIGSTSFFSSSDMHQSYNLFECHTTATNSSLKFF